MNRLRGSDGDSQFVVGFLAAVLLLAGLALIGNAALWFISNPQPEAFVEYLNAPRFSVLDAFGVVLLFLIIGVVLIIPRYMPYYGGSR